MFAFIHRLLGGNRTPQDTQWPRPLPQGVEGILHNFSTALNHEQLLMTDSVIRKIPLQYRSITDTHLFPRMVHAVNEDRLKAALKPQPDAWRTNFTKTPEQRKADHAKSVATKALKKARTDQLRRELRQSVEEA